MSKAIDDLFHQALKETGVRVQASAAGIATFAAEQASALAGCVGLPGFDEAVKAATDNVALFAGIRAAREGDAADAKARGLVVGLLLGLAR
jgi:hypothetical protein